MQNLSVHDCEGNFTDSNEGTEEGQYAHNEDLTFTICVDGANEIIVVFDYFATEANHDVLSAYDGPDTNAQLIAQLSGSLQPPPTLLALSGCITFHFESDENIAAIGWQASWSVEINDPEPPEFQLADQVFCPMVSAAFSAPGGIPCDVLIPENFTLVGPTSVSVVEVLILDCDNNTNTAENFELIFEPEANLAGNYRLFFNAEIHDKCGNLHEVETNILIHLSNCPLSVEIQLQGDPQCSGDCAEFFALVDGGSGNYTYSWDFTDENEERITLCTDQNTDISLEVFDVDGDNSGTAFISYQPLELPVFINPFASDTFCASRGDHFYQTSIPGGEFYSEIIPAGHRTTGRYQFWRWRTAADPVNMDVITYYAPNGCTVTDTVFVKHIRSGSREAACLGADPWIVNGGFPDNGYWSGPFIDSNGLFSPLEEGSFLITYHAENGCSENKRIDVGEELIMPDIDTICSSQLYFLEATIYGGRWYGPGIRNQINGRLEPWRVDPNQTYTYTYILEGCEEEIDIYIKELYAGGTITLCSADSLLFLPTAGDWSGPGTYIEHINAFDISDLGPGEYDFTLRLGDCEDQLTLNLKEVVIGQSNSVFFCPQDQLHHLGDFLWAEPGGGVFYGNGLISSGDHWYFNPADAGPGTHHLYYEILNCQDSIQLTVDHPADIPEYSFCDQNNPVFLTAIPPGGLWSGAGFLNPGEGLFDPRLAGEGMHAVTYTAPSGCVTHALIEVAEFEEVRIEGTAQQYCYIDSAITISTEPPGGIFTINGTESDPFFSPAQLGTGIHEFLYRKGEGACASSHRVFVSVLNAISVQSGLNNDTICKGENAVLELTASGGTGGLVYTWGGDLGFGSSQIVFPDHPAWYQVTVEDDCSEPLIDSVYVHVHSLPEIEYQTGPAVCYGEQSFVEVTSGNSGNLHFQWIGDSLITGSRLDAGPGVYSLLVSDEDSGCTKELSLSIPGPGPLIANFSTIPNQPCIDLANNRLTLVNLSFGYEQIWVDFGDGTGLEDYSLHDFIEHEYTEPGEYSIKLMTENELGCRDTFSKSICVENVVRMYIPNAFSPNGDGNNDFLRLYSLGVNEEVEWEIYDRYGARVFQSNRLSDKWDGTFRGQPLPPGFYLLIANYRDEFTGKEYSKTREVKIIK